MHYEIVKVHFVCVNTPLKRRVIRTYFVRLCHVGILRLGKKSKQLAARRLPCNFAKKIILPYAYIHKSCISLLFLLHLFIHSSFLGELCFVGLSLLCMCSLYIRNISLYTHIVCMYAYGTWYDIKMSLPAFRKVKG